MNRLSIILDYLLWPAILCGGLTAMHYGISHGKGPTVFNITYLCIASLLFLLERVHPHERKWQKSDGQFWQDLAHTLTTKILVQVIIISLINFGIVHQLGER